MLCAYNGISKTNKYVVGEATTGIWVAAANSGDTARRSAVLVGLRHELTQLHRPAMLKLER